MNKDNISVQFQLLNILLGCFQKERKVFSGNSFLPAVKGVVEFLGHLEKLVIPLDDVPAGIHTKLPQQRHHAAQNLSDSPAGESGVYVLDDLAR
jgi:hypothetical protein